MASRQQQSPLVSPIPSLEPYADRYDPFRSSHDPVELSDMVVSPEIGSSDRDRRAPSPGGMSLRSLPRGTYYPASHQYTPLDGPNASRTSMGGLGFVDPGGSLYSMGSLGTTSPYKSKDADTQDLVDKRAGEIAQWKIHWQTPAMVLVLYLAGVGAALGHHFFYAHLDGKPSSAEDQLKQVRYGTALAFFVKSTLTGAVILCYRQRIWRTFRKKAMTLSAIDGLFSVTEDLTQFWNWEMIRNGKLAAFMALCSWLIPIASVLSPASLTSEVRTTYNTTICPKVATLDFTHESLYNYRAPGEYPGSSLVFYNTTDTDAKEEGWFDYFDQPSKNAQRLVVTSAYLRKPSVHPNAQEANCGKGWNCTYTIDFDGPGYKCDEIANSSQQAQLDDPMPINMSQIAPEGDFVYKASLDLDDYVRPQIDSIDGHPKQKSPYPAELGVFTSEPVIWIGYAINTSIPYEDDSRFREKWGNVHEPKIIKCVLHHTKYSFDMDFKAGAQVAKRKSREFGDTLIDTKAIQDLNEPDKTSATPESNFVRPSDTEKYKLTAAYHALGHLMRGFLRGELLLTKKVFISRSDLSQTNMVNASTSYPVANLTESIQQFFEDELITLLSDPALVVAQKARVACLKSQTQNVYVYYPEGLWIGYAIAVAVGFGFILVGAWSIHQNGVASDTQFSRIMVTTRNPTIDRISVGACLGGDPFPKELQETKLRFGVLHEDDSREGPLGKVEHCTFGTVSETKEIVKFGTYAGLKKWRKEEDVEEEVQNVHEKTPLLRRRIRRGSF